ncbi:MAG: hypothetical protein GSR86_03350 [Desulfurococcales archaeon]|nr:hypothetical protein [Desulfurococcales archaeon]
MARVVVEVPEEVAALLEKEPLLRFAVVEAVKKEVMEYLLTVMALDKLTEDSRLREEDVLEISRLVKRAVREKWDAESGG